MQTLGSGGAPYIEGVFRSLGLDPKKDVEFSAVGVGAGALAELQRGNVAALALADTQLAAYENLGTKFRYLPQEDYTKLYTTGGLFVRRDYLSAHRAELCTFGRGIAMGIEFLLANPEAAVRLHWKYYPETKPKGVDEATALKQTSHILQARMTKYDPRRQKIDKYAAYRQEEWMGMVKSLGLEAKVPEAKVRTLYTNDLVGCINDFDRAKVQAQAHDFKM